MSRSSSKILRYSLSGLVAVISAGCFTGVESTPRISSADVRREMKNESVLFSADEENMAVQIVPPPPASWRAGDSFIVCDSKVSLTFPSVAADRLPAPEDTIVFAGYSPSRNVLGEEAVDVRFVTSKADTVSYRVNFPMRDVAERSALEIPFTIPLGMIDRADSLLKNINAYILTPYRYRVSDNVRVDRKKFQPVVISGVGSGTVELPMKVFFSEITDGKKEDFFIYMTPGASRTATRNFPALFSLTDPRLKYPAITDEVWNAITSSKVLPGMTRQECRLALGAPSEVIHGHNYSAVFERWIYQNGLNLIFEDGLLKGIR